LSENKFIEKLSEGLPAIPAWPAYPWVGSTVAVGGAIVKVGIPVGTVVKVAVGAVTIIFTQKLPVPPGPKMEPSGFLIFQYPL
jgi:hypothetical protein